MPVLIKTAIAAAGGIEKYIEGRQDLKAAKNMAATPRPQYNIPGTEFQNLGLIESRASGGLDADSKQLMLNNADRGLSAGITAILQGGGNPNDISKIYDSYMGNLTPIVLADNKAHVDNINNLINERNRLSGFEDKKWMIDTFAPWADQQRAAAQRAALGKGETTAGLNTILNSVLGGADSLTETPMPTAGKSQNSPFSYQAPASYPFQLPVGNAIPAAGPSQSPLSPDYITGNPNSKPFFGMDISGMNANDALMVNQLLYGKSFY